MELNHIELVNKYEPKRAALHESNKKLTAVFIIALFLAIVLALINSNYLNQNIVLFIIVCVLFLSGAICGIIALNRKNNFSKKTIAELRKEVWDAFFPSREENAANGLSYQEVMYPKFFDQPDKFYSSNFMSSSYNDIKFKMSRYRLERREVHHTKNGTTVTYVPYAIGTLLFFDFERDFGQTVKVIEKGGYCYKDRLKKVETEYIDFNKKFTVLSSDETQVFYLLTPQIQEKIMALEKLYEGKFYMAFIDSDLWIAIDDSNNSLKLPLNKPITEQTMKNLEMLLATPKLLIDNLGLAKNKFKKNLGN